MDPVEVFTVDGNDLASVADIVEEMNRSSHGWINLRPELAPGTPPPQAPSILHRVFSNTGTSVPLLTWSAADEEGERPVIGILHGSGPRALQTLRDDGHSLPEGWQRLADHPRRGIVAAVPPDTPAIEVLTWLIEAGRRLALVELGDRWTVQVFRPR